MRYLRDRRWFCGRPEGAGTERRVRVLVLALPAVIVVICLLSVCSSGAPQAHHTSVPELLEELAFPRLAALPTCATSVGELPGAAAQRTKSDLIVGQDDGVIIIFQYDPLDQRTPSHPIQLRLGQRIDDVCSFRVLGRSTAREDILTIALQGTTVTLVSHESRKLIAEIPLPELLGPYSLAVVRGTQTAYVYDARSLRKLVVEPRGGSWSLS
ncbi:hypothetical protein KAW64_13855, partial [bacterium]|nr:hypothetical protein [bacterium]